MTVIEYLISCGEELDFKSREEIDLTYTKRITDFSDLWRFKKLKNFFAEYSSFDDLTHLNGLDLLLIDINGTKIKTLRGISQFTNLYWLDMQSIALNDEGSLMEIFYLKTL